MLYASRVLMQHFKNDLLSLCSQLFHSRMMNRLVVLSSVSHTIVDTQERLNSRSVNPKISNKAYMCKESSRVLVRV